MQHIFLIILLFCVLVAAICSLYVIQSNYRPQYSSHFDNVIIDELSHKYGAASREGGGKPRGNLRLKDLSKNPRSRSEARIIQCLENITGQQFPTAYPAWLVWKGKHLELDGYNGKDIALEFSGPLHTKWTPTKESYTDYFERLIRDVVKRKLCKKNNVTLIVVDSSLPEQHWRAYLCSRLSDAGHFYCNISKDSPNYIAKQKVKPFRNSRLEHDLGISAEYFAALRAGN